MLCKVANNFPALPSGSSAPSSSSASSDQGSMDWSQSSLQQSENILFPHQIGSMDSTCSSWPGHVWRKEPSKYWLESELNNNNNDNRVMHNSGRVSISSTCSDSSFTSDCSYSSYSSTDSDLFSSSDCEDATSSSSSSKNPATISSKEIGDILIHSCKGEEDQNNNNNFNNNNYNKNNTAPTTTTTTTITDKSKKKSDNPAKSRLLDDEGYIRRAACVCMDETESKVLLVSSKRDPCSWLVPGGGMEAGEDMATAAVREAWEEAGVQGHITKYLGLFETKHQNGHKKHRTAVYVVSVKRVMADYPEAYLGRGRQWFTLEEAVLHLARTRPLQSDYLRVLLVSRLNVAAA